MIKNSMFRYYKNHTSTSEEFMVLFMKIAQIWCFSISTCFQIFGIEALKYAQNVARIL